jgi:23S rRNA (cytidine2498-2'-O)-methyltransferase
LPEHAVSRAYLKMREALACFRLPLKRGETVLEIGSSPGGASQALLQAGLKVIGVDPAEMAPQILAEPKFTHWRMRGGEIRKSHCRDVKWITADVNAAPGYTLDVVEGIVSNRHVQAAGLLLTIKLTTWEMAAELPELLDRVRSWGFAWIRARQLSHNRQEYCLAALRQSPHKAKPRGKAS